MACDDDGHLLIFCDLDNPTIPETVITEPDERCHWQQALLDESDTEEKFGQDVSGQAYDAWLNNNLGRCSPPL